MMSPLSVTSAGTYPSGLIVLVILHNVDSMSKAINKLKRQGFKVDDEALRSLSPYRTEHINLLGTYSLKIPKQQGKRNFKHM